MTAGSTWTRYVTLCGPNLDDWMSTTTPPEASRHRKVALVETSMEEDEFTSTAKLVAAINSLGCSTHIAVAQGGVINWGTRRWFMDCLNALHPSGIIRSSPIRPVDQDETWFVALNGPDLDDAQIIMGPPTQSYQAMLPVLIQRTDDGRTSAAKLATALNSIARVPQGEDELRVYLAVAVDDVVCWGKRLEFWEAFWPGSTKGHVFTRGPATVKVKVLGGGSGGRSDDAVADAGGHKLIPANALRYSR